MKMLRKLKWPGIKLFGPAAMALILFTPVSSRAEDDLSVHYTFEEGTVEATKQQQQVIDHTANKNNGTLYGATYVKLDDGGYAIAFDGRKSFVKCANKKRVNFGEKDFTIQCRIKLDSLKSGVLMGKKGTTRQSKGWDIAYDGKSRNIIFTVSDGEQQQSVAAPGLSDLQWHNLAIVRQEKKITVYLDGKPAASETNDLFGAEIGNDQAFLFLGRPVGAFLAFHGELGEVRIYDRALTAEEISATSPAQEPAVKNPAAKANAAPKTSMVNASKGPLVLHYTFDQDTGDIAKDASSYGNDGKTANTKYIKEFNGRHGILRFDGKTSSLDCGNDKSLALTGDLSFEMWVRQNEPYLPGDGWSFIFGEYPPHNFVFTTRAHHTLSLDYRYNNNPAIIPVDRKILGNKWSHIAVVIEYPRCKFYHNGKLIRDAYMPLPLENPSIRNKFLGGAVTGNDKAKAPIDIDEFRLYRCALTDKQVAAHYQGKEAEPELTAELASDLHWYNDTLTLRLNLQGGKFENSKADCSLTATDEKKILFEQDQSLQASQPGSGRYTATWITPLSKLKAKSLLARVKVSAPNGKIITTVSKTISLKQPEWVHNREGFPKKVLQPWTPVKTQITPDKSIAVDVWGRQYHFNNSLFPAEIEAMGKKLLAAPVRLSATVDNHKLNWQGSFPHLINSNEQEAVFEQTLTDKDITLSVKTTVEFDGYMTYECKLEALNKLKLDTLKFEIPLQSKYATLAYGDRVFKGKPRHPLSCGFAGFLKEQKDFLFSPCVWVGDDKTGLLWQSESDEFWHNKDPQKAIQITPGKSVTMLSANLVDTPVEMATGRKLYYKFALQATPVKPMLRDDWQLRSMRSGPYGNDMHYPERTYGGKPMLQYLAEDAGIRALFFNVGDDWPWPMPIHEKFSNGLHSFIKEAHRYGLKVYPYLIHVRYPVQRAAFDPHGSHMVRNPTGTYVPGGVNKTPSPRPGPVAAEYGANSQGTMIFCPKSMATQDSYIHSLAQRIDTYNDDGVYLDGTAQVMECKNPEHGCGYKDANGVLHETFPVFACRQFIKRIYTVIHTRKPDGIIELHTWYYNPAQLAFADLAISAEQWWHLRHTGAPDGYLSAELPLDMFRTMFIGTQAGTPFHLLSYRLGSTMKLAAISLLHDVPVQLNQGGQSLEWLMRQDNPDSRSGKEQQYFKMLTELWRVRDKFGMEKAEKLFYWQNRDYVSIAPELCYATLFKHPQNGVLALVSNLSRKQENVTVKFNLKQLGLAGKKLEVFDPLNKKPLKMDADGKLTLPLESEAWIYVWLRPAGK